MTKLLLIDSNGPIRYASPCLAGTAGVSLPTHAAETHRSRVEGEFRSEPAKQHDAE